MSLFEEQLEEMKRKTASVGVTPGMAMKAPVSDNLLGIEAPQHWTEKAMEKDGKGKFFAKMLLGGFTGMTPLLFPEAIGSKARYANDLDMYKDEIEHAREQAMRQKYVDVLNDPNSSHTDRMAAAAMAGGVDKFDPNPITASPGSSILGAGTGSVLHSQPHKPVPPPAAVAEATAIANAKGISTDSPIFGDLVAATAEPTETRTNPADGSTYSVNTVQEVLARHEEEQQAQQQQVLQQQQGGQPGQTQQQQQPGQPGQPGQPQQQDPNTLGPVLAGINEEQATMVREAPEKLKFYRRFGEIISGLGRWDEKKGEFVLNEDTTDLYGSWDGNRLNPQNWGSSGADNGGFGGDNEYFMPQGNRDAKAGVEQMIESLAVDERGKLKGQGQITEGETAMLRAAVTQAAKRGMGNKAAQREFTRLYKEYIKAMQIQQGMLERYWPDNPILQQQGQGDIPRQSVGSSDMQSTIIDLDQVQQGQ